MRLKDISLETFMNLFQYEMWYPYDGMGTFKIGDPLPSSKRQVHYTFEPAE